MAAESGHKKVADLLWSDYAGLVAGPSVARQSDLLSSISIYISLERDLGFRGRHVQDNPVMCGLEWPKSPAHLRSV